MNELDELRLKIATAKGYTFWDSLDKLGPWPRKNNPVAAFYAGGIPLYKVDDPDPAKITWYDNDPDWPRDITAAWELVEEMRAHVGPRGIEWYCKTQRDVNEPGAVYEWGTTAPEAICRAYLAWREGDHE